MMGGNESFVLTTSLDLSTFPLLERVIIGDHMLNGLTSFAVSGREYEDESDADLTHLQSLQIGASSLRNVTSFSVSSLSNLQTFEIGEESLSSVTSLSLSGISSSLFSFTEFNQLTILSLHSGSFSYATELSLRNLPMLRSLVIGHSCFKKASIFVLESKIHDFFDIIDVPEIQTISIGAGDDSSENHATLGEVESLSIARKIRMKE